MVPLEVLKTRPAGRVGEIERESMLPELLNALGAMALPYGYLTGLVV
jgi:hypothetical protein